ncbi:hypothetical protein MLD38_032813 [Melastoma candidum]|uniref:Uncharacterized protein n=1 Tax=Melastoma candidum TaxID=119954 RepID=A0ACB9M4U1_9MYRT|nr:hypothetical protein MLD38_032813 [Melastoma candidum]
MDSIVRILLFVRLVGFPLAADYAASALEGISSLVVIATSIMGCLYSKGSAIEDNQDSPKDGTVGLGSARGEIRYGIEDKMGGEVDVVLIDQKGTG